MEEKIKELLKNINIQASLDIEDEEEVIISSDDWPDYVSFSLDLDNPEDVLIQIEKYFNMKYIPYLGCYYEDYAEFIVNVSSV